MFLEAFERRLKASHFSELFSRTPTNLMEEILVKLARYVKWVESSVEKRVINMKEHNNERYESSNP